MDVYNITISCDKPGDEFAMDFPCAIPLDKAIHEVLATAEDFIALVRRKPETPEA